MGSVEFQRFKVLLKTSGHFVTKPRMYIFGLLQHHSVSTFKELIKLAKRHDQVTVYRTIDLFEKLGIINRIQLGWHTKIELSDTFQHHHHHLTCLKCGKVIALAENKSLEAQLTQLAQRFHFHPTDHQLEIRGYCQSCKKRPRDKSQGRWKPHTSIH
jgi:Fur family ferric uptake transcriptional regulator